MEGRSQTEAPGGALDDPPPSGHPCQLTTQEPECGEGAAGGTFAGDTAPWGADGSLAVNESPGPGRSLKMAVSAVTYSNQPTGLPRGKMHRASRLRLDSSRNAPGPERRAAVTPWSGGNAATRHRGPSTRTLLTFRSAQSP